LKTDQLILKENKVYLPFPLYKQDVMKTGLLLFIGFLLAGTAFSQNNKTADSLERIKDSVKFENLLKTAIYPLIKSGKMSGVLPVTGITEKPDPTQQYLLLKELANGIKDSVVAKEQLAGFQEVGRLINLHIASGIPLNKIHMVLVAHAGAIKGFYTNEIYRKEFGCDNPNLALLDELKKAGVRFIVCGQAMHFQEIKKEELLPIVRVSLTAQTALSNYQLKGYVLYTD
jgi:intracellular sulfur oxidation DsrE/DsrF family protein